MQLQLHILSCWLAWQSLLHTVFHVCNKITSPIQIIYKGYCLMINIHLNILDFDGPYRDQLVMLA